MKNYLTILAAGAAALLCFNDVSSACEAHRHASRNTWHRSRTVVTREFTGNNYVIVRGSPRTFALTGTPIRDRDEPFISRAVRAPFRAAGTALRSPLIVGETLAGQRDFVSDRGILARRDIDDGRVYGNSGDVVVTTTSTDLDTPVAISGPTLSGRREIKMSDGRVIEDRGRGDNLVDYGY